MCGFAYLQLFLSTALHFFSWNRLCYVWTPGGCREIVLYAIIVTSRAPVPASLAKFRELHTKS
jgi:hypothetical protein